MKSHNLLYTRLILAILAVAASSVLIVGVRPAKSFQQREIVYNIPESVPIKVRFKSTKESKFKDLNNSDWLRDLELEVTNTSNRPIYFLEFWLMLPDIRSESDNPLAFSLRYGRADFIRPETQAIVTDLPIQPGETHSFAIPEGKQQGWREFKVRRRAPDPEKVRIKFVQLSFGDGTGFNSSGESYPFRKRSLIVPNRDSPAKSAEAGLISM